MLTLRHVALLGLASVLASPAAGQATFTVTTTADAGAGSLRQAILDANAAPGAGLIAFAIPGAGPHAIRPASALPAVTGPVSLDGLTQPGADCATWPATLPVVLDGSDVPDGTNGLHLVAGSDGSTVRGLVVHSFLSEGGLEAGVFFDGSDGSAVECSFLGTGPDGVSGRPNVLGVRVTGSDGVRVGGPEEGQRNLISGNLLNVWVRGSAADDVPTGTVIQGNYIGTDATGAATVGGTAFSSVSVQGAAGTLIGGTEPGAGNVVVGGGDHGVFVGSVPPEDPPTTGTVVQGNRIGTDAAGMAALPNARDGVFLFNAGGTLVGGPEDGARNLLSGNGSSGVAVFRGEGGRAAAGNRIENNYIGTDATGLDALGNEFLGVFLAGSDGAEVTGTELIGNVIAANFRGVSVFAGATGTTVQGNHIGVGADGVTPLGNESIGIEVFTAGNLVGGREPGQGNVVGANGNSGISLIDPSATGNRVEGNYVGVGADGVTPVGQVAADGSPGTGVTVFRGAVANVIGGDAPGAGNVVAFNDGIGIHVFDEQTRAIAIRRNAVFQNGGRGIDIDAVTNDAADADAGPNNLQNHPVLASVVGDGASTLEVAYAVPSDPAHSAYPITVEFFLADADSTEGAAFLGAAVYDEADVGQEVTAAFAPRRTVADGALVLATATDADGNTSEFGGAVAAVGTAVEAEPGTGAAGLALSAPVPNPAPGVARFALRLDRPRAVSAAAYDVLGRRVAVLHDGPLAAGAHALAFDGGGLPDGVYLVRVRAGGLEAVRAVTLAR